MTDFLPLIAGYGYVLLAGVVFAEAIGLPVPAALALLAAGSAAASGSLNTWFALVVAALATLVGDSILFVLGRYTGWALLGTLCRVSMNPESCILRSAESFYRRGKTTLVLAKFIPGINTMAPPLAGSMKMRPLQFLQFDLAGTILYVGGFFWLGYLFRDFLAAIIRGVAAAGHISEIVLLVGLAGYIVYRGVRYWKQRMYRVVPRVEVQELARRLAMDGDNILVADVRSHGYYDEDAARIKGSIRIEPNNLIEELKSLSRHKEIYLYCT